jgi:glutamate synthase (NADPH/NADH) small chain
MSNQQGPVWKAQHAWSEVDQTGPPKRPAEKRVADFKEIYTSFDEATVRAQASRCIQCPDAACVKGCPLHNRIPEWLALAAEGDFIGAARVSHATSNMPEICSRVCPQERLCEGSCILIEKTEPVCIGAIEKFINEYALARNAIEVRPAPLNGLSAAMVGSGPASLACADELAKRGFAVSIFESQMLAGGLLMGGIPAFKLEKHVVDRRVSLLRQMGVSVRLGVTVGRDIALWELLTHFDTVFLGVGAQKAKPLDIPGAELSGVQHALPFLVEKNVEFPMETPPTQVEGKRVAVLGGGDTAMDCLRTAIRCGAMEASCIYRRDLANMPGSRKEYGNALEEGTHFMFLTNPIALLGDEQGRVRGVRCVRMELGEPDESGRRKPRKVPGSDFEVPAELVLVAYGFDPVPFPPDSDLSRIKVNEWGGIVVDDRQMTSVPGVFAGGDSSRGASLVVHAVRDARRAAESMDAWARIHNRHRRSQVSARA